VDAEAQPRRRQELESKRRAAKEAAMQEQPIQPLSWEERRERLSRIVSNKTLEGWTVVDMNERDVWAVLDLPEKPVNHVLHAIITFFTCGLWGIVWLILTLTHRRQQRIRISIDPLGNIREEKVTLA
jgi:hypothetical protein